ncbi:LuxR family transcriptional regulator [Streptomyces sp. A012304]|uniref:helix-turn-helix transcriptional regulator n=1 Tax=Streptomyces sp. A012304 TaxID=375446 RepID=UPI002232C39A|nr:LuxR family transcriptional regulator [Streptomyces sp. A012304]GKQ36205.1 hypothetical protein ALMP_27480 [Streptomyces sp. A012304]
MNGGLFVRLVERETELGLVAELVAATGNGEGSVLLVDAPVASGKTEILQAVEREAIRHGALTLTANASVWEKGFALAVVAQLLENVPGEAHPGWSDTKLRLKEFHGRTQAGERPPVDLLRDIHELLVELAEKSPVVVVVDDLHHSDGASLSLLLGLARRGQRKPMLFAFGQQSSCMRGLQLFQTELRRLPHCSHMPLKPLSPAGVARFLAQHLDDEQALRLAPVHEALSGGNPLLVRALLDDYRGAVAPTADGPARTGPGLVPGDTYRQAVTACLQRGSADAADVAHALAVLHTSGSPHLTARLLELGRDGVERVRRVLAGSGLLTADGFRHPVAREAVLEHMPPARRTALHLRAARLLFDDGAPATTVATHLLAAGQAREPWAARVLCEAAEQVLREDRATLAQNYLELVLRDSGDPVQQATVTLQLARSVWRRSPDRALRRTLSMVDTFDLQQATEEQAIQLVKSLLRHGMFGDAETVLEGLADRVGRAPDPSSDDLQAFRLWLACSYPVLARRFPLAPPSRPGRATLTGATRTSPLLQATTLLHTVLSGAPAQHEIAATQQELQVLRLDDETLEPLGTALMALVYVDWIDAAELWCKELLAEATERGVPAWIGVLSSVMAEVALRRGDLRATEKYARAALSHISSEGWGVAVGSTRAALLTALTARGDFRTAGQLVNEPLPDSIFDTRDGLHYQQARGRFHLALGHPHAALRDFEDCSARMREWGLDRPSLLSWRTDAARALLALNRVDEARRLAREQLELLGPDSPRIRGLTLRVLAATAPSEQRLALLGRAVDDLESAHDALELAQALGDLSRARGATGDPVGARHAMVRARQLARACHAEVLLPALREPEEEMVPRRPDTVARPLDEEHGPAELSEAERRVARLVAKGRSNREVASLLFITVSTVEQHLTSIYRKLHINRRAELRSAYLELT